ncbi:hydroxyacid dehydrogenase [Aureimonas sp. AU22]|uniref:hydroxyacid dehydrogenase n=1 Tax=Aureimonas sp. AU22 TaxID=1638162 RepID=UPI000705FF4B|nr:hydroxyacid dehydrogenase [Aureimonas sp. AU22]BAT29808.1 dimethylmenaquinone methyltransferase [Aureimonas sp. AU22]
MPESHPQDGSRTRRILVTHNSIAPSAVELLNRHDVDVFFSPPYDAPEIVAERARDLAVDAIMVRQGKVNDLVIGASPKLKVIVKHGVGIDNIDVASAARRGIPVLRSLNSNSLAVAEHTIALALTLLKEVTWLDPAVKRGEWPKPTFIGRDIAGSVIGLIGFGAIGRETARLAEALGMEVTVHDPMAKPGAIEAAGHTRADRLDDLLAAADIVSLHCPLTQATRHLIDAPRLARMKPTAFLVNTARGGIVDEAALAEALSERRIAGAALDSFASEPPAADSPLWSLPNLVATPHIGGVTNGSARAMAEIAARHIIDVLDGKAPDAASLSSPDAFAA